MISRFITERSAIEKLNLPPKCGSFERMALKINTARKGTARLSGRIACSPPLKSASYSAVLYCARLPLDLEIGRSENGMAPAVGRNDRRWLRASLDPRKMFPASFAAAELTRSGAFKLDFLPGFLSENLFQNIVVIGRTGFIAPLQNNERTPDFSGEHLDDEATFLRYMDFLKGRRAYLSDFTLRSLVSNPSVVAAADLGEACTISFT